MIDETMRMVDGPLFMYDHGTRLVVLSQRMEIDRTAQMTPHAHGDVDGFTWADDGGGGGGNEPFHR
jgi:hypothetical protein